MPKPPDIKVSTIISGRMMDPIVELQWGENVCHMTPAEARRHASTIAAAASSAEMDAYLHQYLTGNNSFSTEQVATIMNDFRAWRARELMIPSPPMTPKKERPI
jgi:hypothetical protein